MAIANPLPSWDLPPADMHIGNENKDFINPDQTNIDFWKGGPGSPQNWISEDLADGFVKPKTPSPRISKPAPFSACKHYKSFCCDDSMPATNQIRIDCRPCKPPLID